jgi:hypothetical protein
LSLRASRWQDAPLLSHHRDRYYPRALAALKIWHRNPAHRPENVEGRRDVLRFGNPA